MDKAMMLQEHELHKIAVWLQKEVGIVLGEQKLKRFARKIEDVISTHKFESFTSFYHTLRYKKEQKLAQDLINAITVNETYFWREHEQFLLLTNKILPLIDKLKDSAPIRILVLPCSSGEEVYSIMMAIIEYSGLIQKRDFEVIGLDIDSSMVLKAQRGIYSQRSIEKLPEPLLKKYFHAEHGMYHIDPLLRTNATFLQGNIFDNTMLHRLGQFDIIFSRNMLIYFDTEDKQRAYNALYTLLVDNGYLFLGHADANGIDKRKFQPLQVASQIYKKL